ncbi:MAG: hypothetical protein HYV07_10000 [Deltaproteobacteria bacterium]|nr:hypothetical protein [Deltaproteobacteria bacterium]
MSRCGWRGRWLLLGLGLLGCGPVAITLETDPDDFLVVFDPGTADAKIVLASGDRFGLSVEDEDSFLFWVVKSGDRVWEDGRPVPMDLVADARVSFGAASGTADGCGRCLTDPDARPQLVGPGSTCPIPIESRAYRGTAASLSTPQEAAAFRDELRIQWPGPCPCRALDEGPDPSIPPLRFETVWPMQDGTPYTTHRISPDGTAFLVGELGSLAIAPDGKRTHSDALGCSTLDAVPIGASMLVPGSGLFVARPSGARSRSTVQRLDSALDASAEQVIEGIDITAMEWFGEAESALIAGHRSDFSTTSPLISTCQLGASGFDCANLLPPELGDRMGASTFVRLANGAVLVANSSTLTLLSKLPRRVEVRGTQLEAGADGDASGSILMADGSRVPWSLRNSGDVVPGDLRSLAADGNQLFLCSTEGLFSTFFDLEDLRGVDFVPTEPVPGLTGCDAVWWDGALRRVHVSVGSSTFAWFEGAWSETSVRGVAGIESWQESGDWTLAKDSAGRFFRRQGQGTFERVHGAERLNDDFRVVVSRNDELWLFPRLIATSSVVVVSGARSPETLFLGDLAGLGPRDELRAAAYDPASDEFALVGGDEGGWIRLFDPGSHSMRVVELDTDRGLVPRTVTRVGFDAFLVTGESSAGASVWILRENEVSPLPVDWDDPKSSELEEARSCRGFSSSAASGGVGWVAGCDSPSGAPPGAEVLLRVTPFAAEPGAHAVNARSELGTMPQRSKVLVGALCPGRIVYGIEGPDHAGVFAEAEQVDAELRKRRHEVPFYRVVDFRAHELIRIFGTEADVHVLSSDYLDMHGSRTRLALGRTRLVDAAEASDGTVALIAEGGRAILGRPCEVDPL